MGRRGSEDFDPSEQRRSIAQKGQLLVTWGWILIIGALIWVWVVFFTKESEIGVWIAAAVGGVGYLLQRAGNRRG